jgi:hypothetical protein
MIPAIHSRWAALVLLLAWSANAPAQTQNQIAGFGFTPSFYSPILPSVSPGEVLTLFTSPLGVPDAVATQTPWPNSLSGVSVPVQVVGTNDTTGYPGSLPILRVLTETRPTLPSTGGPCSAVVGPTPLPCSFSQITVQIPVELVCVLAVEDLNLHEDCSTAPPAIPPMLVLNIEANGVTGPDLPVQLAGGGHFLNSCDAIFGLQSSSTCHSLVTHADGSLVTGQSPANVGETIVIYGVGGPVDPFFLGSSEEIVGGLGLWQLAK